MCWRWRLEVEKLLFILSYWEIRDWILRQEWNLKISKFFLAKSCLPIALRSELDVNFAVLKHPQKMEGLANSSHSHCGTQQRHRHADRQTDIENLLSVKYKKPSFALHESPFLRRINCITDFWRVILSGRHPKLTVLAAIVFDENQSKTIQRFISFNLPYSKVYVFYRPTVVKLFGPFYFWGLVLPLNPKRSNFSDC